MVYRFGYIEKINGNIMIRPHYTYSAQFNAISDIWKVFSLGNDYFTLSLNNKMWIF